MIDFEDYLYKLSMPDKSGKAVTLKEICMQVPAFQQSSSLAFRTPREQTQGTGECTGDGCPQLKVSNPAKF